MDRTVQGKWRDSLESNLLFIVYPKIKGKSLKTF